MDTSHGNTCTPVVIDSHTFGRDGDDRIDRARDVTLLQLIAAGLLFGMRGPEGILVRQVWSRDIGVAGRVAGDYMTALTGL